MRAALDAAGGVVREALAELGAHAVLNADRNGVQATSALRNRPAGRARMYGPRRSTTVSGG